MIVKINSKDNKKQKERIVFFCVIAIFFTVVFSFVFSSKTFLRRAYDNNEIIINIPFFTFFVSDSDNVLELKSLKNREYLNNFYDRYVFQSVKFSEYYCNEKKFYFNQDTGTLIYSIDIISGETFNTIRIVYSDKTIEEVCF